MDEPFFSIVTVVRNDEEGLRATGRSLERQTWRDFAWMIIDGNSNDGTSTLVAELFAVGAATGVSERDRGIYDAMNKGLRLATGRYVVFLNAGDCLIDDAALTTAAGELAGAGHPDVGFFASIMDFGAWKVTRKVKPPSYIWHGQPGLHQATFVRREVHQRFPFRTKFRIVGDYDLVARLARADVAMRSFAPIINVNQFEASAASARNKLRLIRECASVQREVLRLPYASIGFSALRRSVNSIVFKSLTTWRAISRT